ncbi:MAG: MFS transporter [Negativicutes bacterium]|nr:MFS transporter [Negativicutes bacterium]
MDATKKNYRWWVILLLFTGTFVNAVDRGSLGVATPSIMKDLNLDPAMMGVVLSAFFWSYFLGNIPSGALADKFGAKATLGWAAFIWSFLSALTGAAANFTQMVCFRFGVGAGESALQPCNVKVVKSVFPTEERATAIGIFNAGIRLGLAVVPILMAFLITTWSWRIAFYVTGIGSLVWVALWYYLYKEAKPDASIESASKEKVPWLKLLKHRSIIGIMLCKFFQEYLYNMFLTWLPAYLVMERGFTVLKMGWYASLPWIVTFLALPLIGLLSDTLIKRGMSVTASRKGMIVIGQLIASSIVFAVYADSPTVAMAFLVVALVCESGASTVLWSVCAEIAPRNTSASVAGIMNTAGAVAGIVSPIVTGVLLKLTGNFQQAFLVASLMIVFAALSMWFIVGKVEQIELD